MKFFLGDGTTWDPVSGESGDGRRLERVSGRRLFALAWQDAHGSDAFNHPKFDTPAFWRESTAEPSSPGLMQRAALTLSSGFHRIGDAFPFG